MRRARPIAAVAVAVALLFSSVRAEARTPLETETIVAGAVAGAVDLVLATLDLVQAARPGRPSGRYAGVELTLMTIQLTLGISLLASLGNAHATVYDQFGNPTVLDTGGSTILPIGVLLTVAAAALGIHATWALRHAEPDRHASLPWAPTVAASSRQVIFGLAGRF